MTGATDGRAVGAGALLALAIAGPTIAVFAVADAAVGIAPESNVVFLFYLGVLAGLVLGGRRAGRRRPEAPLTHGSLAALAAYAAIAFVSSAVRLADGRAVDPVALVFQGFMAASAGILGGLLATRRPATPQPAPGGEGP